ncbi:MAG: hypothetical protein IPM79_05245 [Polyangiaceae bacterium]|nr:hypothetical protein [Polyangiaceae bacterium]
MRRWLAWPLFVAWLLAVGCLEPLPLPGPCEPPDRVIDGECVSCDDPREFVGDVCKVCPPEPAFATKERCIPNAFVDHGLPPPGCAAGDGIYARFECLMGDLPCDCPSFELADSEPLCFSEGCPSFVLERYAGAQCAAVDGEAIQWAGLFPSEGCGCGCLEALAHCDGRGYAVGYFADETHTERVDLDSLYLPIVGQLPAAGTFGVYIRARGFALPFLVAPVPEVSDFGWGFYTTSDFVEAIGYGAEDEGIISDFAVDVLYTYSEQAGPPSAILIAGPSADPGIGTFGMFEIDCVIPFAIGD